METENLVSIIVPLYNSSTTIKRAVQSALRQTYPYIEVIVVDDGSDDEGLLLVEQMHDNRIRCYRLPHCNANVARNYGISHSQGNYIAMLDADDEWTEYHVEHSLKVLLCEQADGIYGSLILRGKSDKLVTTRAIRPNETTIDFLLSQSYGAQTSTLLMTAHSAKDVLWDKTLNRHQDYDFMVRYCKKYRMVPKLEATTIYHQASSPRAIDFDSCIRFIHTVEDEISDWLYISYHRSMLHHAIIQSADEAIIHHYREAATYYIYQLSLYDYLTIWQPKNAWEAWIMKMKYLYKLLWIKLVLN